MKAPASKCKVCSHPKRKDLEEKLRNGMAPKKLDAWLKKAEARAGALCPAVSHATIEKHWKVCLGNPNQSQKAAIIANGTNALPDTIAGRRKFLEDESFLLLGMGSPDPQRTTLLRCTSEMLERRAKGECYCDRIEEHPEVLQIRAEYEAAIQALMKKEIK